MPKAKRCPRPACDAVPYSCKRHRVDLSSSAWSLAECFLGSMEEMENGAAKVRWVSGVELKDERRGEASRSIKRPSEAEPVSRLGHNDRWGPLGAQSPPTGS